MWGFDPEPQTVVWRKLGALGVRVPLKVVYLSFFIGFRLSRVVLRHSLGLRTGGVQDKGSANRGSEQIAYLTLTLKGLIF